MAAEPRDEDCRVQSARLSDFALPKDRQIYGREGLQSQREEVISEAARQILDRTEQRTDQDHNETHTEERAHTWRDILDSGVHMSVVAAEPHDKYRQSKCCSTP